MAECGRTIEDHLRGLSGLTPITDDVLVSVLYQANVPCGMPLTDLSEEEVDRATAWLYVWMLHLLPYSKNNTKDSDGGWEHTEGGYQLLEVDRRRWLSYLRWLYRRYRWKWLEELLDEEKESRIVVFNL